MAQPVIIKIIIITIKFLKPLGGTEITSRTFVVDFIVVIVGAIVVFLLLILLLIVLSYLY